jgi:hypothetical protein
VVELNNRKLVYVQPEKLGQSWGLVRPGVEYIRETFGDYWSCEDVYSEVRFGRSSLHIFYTSGAYDGFAVSSMQANRWTGEPEMLMWLVYCVGSTDTVDYWLENHFMKVAKSSGAFRLVFYSPRESWDVRLKKFGAKIRNIEYEIPL